MSCHLDGGYFEKQTSEYVHWKLFIMNLHKFEYEESEK